MKKKLAKQIAKGYRGKTTKIDKKIPYPDENKQQTQNKTFKMPPIKVDDKSWTEVKTALKEDYN